MISAFAHLLPKLSQNFEIIPHLVAETPDNILKPKRNSRTLLSIVLALKQHLCRAVKEAGADNTQ